MSTNTSLKAITAKLKKVKTAVNKSNGSGKNKTFNLEDTIVREAINDIEDVVSTLVKLLEEGEQLCPKIKELEDQNRKLEDEMDHQAQRNLKGKFMLSSSKNSTIIKTDEELGKEGTTLVTHIQNLIQMKLGVEVPKEDVSSCSRTSTGLLLFRLNNFRPCSSFHNVVDAIKSGKNREVDLFFNFALTRRRAALLYEVRMLKKNNKIHKFFTDADGQITIKTTADSKKIKICSVWNKRDFSMKTDTTVELRDRLESSQI